MQCSPKDVLKRGITQEISPKIKRNLHYYIPCKQSLGEVHRIHLVLIYIIYPSSMFYLSSAVTIPATGVDSRWPDLLTSNLHSALFRGSFSERLRDLKSSFMHCDQVFLGHSCFPGQGIFILVIGCTLKSASCVCTTQVVWCKGLVTS
jgi:hypothetical protein